MMVLFVLAVCGGCVALFLYADETTQTKAIVASIFAVSLSLQFVPAFYIHWLPPLLMQIALAIGLLFYFKLQKY